MFSSFQVSRCRGARFIICPCLCHSYSRLEFWCHHVQATFHNFSLFVPHIFTPGELYGQTKSVAGVIMSRRYWNFQANASRSGRDIVFEQKLSANIFLLEWIMTYRNYWLANPLYHVKALSTIEVLGCGRTKISIAPGPTRGYRTSRSPFGRVCVCVCMFWGWAAFQNKRLQIHCFTCYTAPKFVFDIPIISTWTPSRDIFYILDGVEGSILACLFEVPGLSEHSLAYIQLVPPRGPLCRYDDVKKTFRS